MNVLRSTSSGAARLADGALELTVVGGFASTGIRVRRRMFGWSDPPRLDGRRVVITGATSGIGLACARAMIDLGAQVSIVGRDPDRTRATARDLGRRSASEVTTYIADLDLLGNARRVADEIDADGRPVDVLVHNAGALTAEYRRTEDGFEATYAAQVLSQHILTSRLLPALQRSSSPRVIVVASGGMYAEKLDVATVQMTASDYDGVRAYARPGVQASLPTFRRLTRPILRTPQEGADTIVWLAGVDPIPGANGSFWLDRAPRATVRSPGTRPAPGDPAALWDLVCQQTGEAPACPG